MEAAKGATFFNHFTQPKVVDKQLKHVLCQNKKRQWVLETVFSRGGNYFVHYNCALHMHAGII